MKTKYKSIMAVVLAAILILSTVTTAFAALSYERVDKDYRNMDIMNKSGVRINKPTAHFMAKRVANGEVLDNVFSYADYDCTVDFPTLTCYVGDTVQFEDHSYDNNGGKIVEWDWQYYGSMGDFNKIYTTNPVNTFKINCTTPGETIFYLCVKSNASVKTGCCDPWSENGNHQVVGKNKWFPKGAYWYFTAIRVVIKPVTEAVVHVRYWDAQNNKIIEQEDVNLGRLERDDETRDTCVQVKDLSGYEFLAWNVQLPDGTIQYSGNEREACVTMATWVPEKYLNIEYLPIGNTSVDVKYWNSAENKVIKTETVTGDTVVGEQETKLNIPLVAPTGYKINGWNVMLDNGEIQYTGEWNPVEVILNGYIPHKTLNVECSATSGHTGNYSEKRVEVTYVDEETQKTLDEEIKYGTGIGQSEDMSIELKDISGYAITGWTLKTTNKSVEKTGMSAPVEVHLTNSENVKYLIVNCLSLDDGDDDPIPPPTIIVKPTGDCDGIIEWTETDSHRVLTGYNSKGKAIYKTCSHTFTYRTTLTANAKISPDKFKSGYGFELEVPYSISTKLISNNGGCSSWGKSRSATASVSKPTKATVYIPWNMTNSLGTQPTAITMDKNGTSSFILPQSNVSSVKARKIYTPVELAGTSESPEKHSFEIYINGGGVNRIEFCKKLTGTITINGDMYEDDFSGSD